MKKLKLPKAARRQADVVRSTPKTTHVKGGDVVRSSPKTTHPGKNLGRYLYRSKLPAGGKIGTAGVKMKPRKSNKVKGY
jgi:hypothetical protein